uniref:Uncharacterized protein n=1 Tax=Eutreptiella gymnastica TaxID=73025 RepID=A0A7S4G605_9EUGL
MLCCSQQSREPDRPHKQSHAYTLADMPMSRTQHRMRPQHLSGRKMQKEGSLAWAKKRGGKKAGLHRASFPTNPRTTALCRTLNAQCWRLSAVQWHIITDCHRRSAKRCWSFVNRDSGANTADPV